MSELIGWFDEAGFSFVSSIPKIIGTFRDNENLFAPQKAGSVFDRTIAEIGMLMSSSGGEGGLFVCIGKRKTGRRPGPPSPCIRVSRPKVPFGEQLAVNLNKGSERSLC